MVLRVQPRSCDVEEPAIARQWQRRVVIDVSTAMVAGRQALNPRCTLRLASCKRRPPQGLDEVRVLQCEQNAGQVHKRVLGIRAGVPCNRKAPSASSWAEPSTSSTGPGVTGHISSSSTASHRPRARQHRNSAPSSTAPTALTKAHAQGKRVLQRLDGAVHPQAARTGQRALVPCSTWWQGAILSQGQGTACTALAPVHPTFKYTEGREHRDRTAGRRRGDPVQPPYPLPAARASRGSDDR